MERKEVPVWQIADGFQSKKNDKKSRKEKWLFFLPAFF
jgi:hypothetical protein